MIVYFVGAGPGDPELLTLKGKKLLERADVVVYAGSLVSPALLEFLKPNAERLDSARMTLEEIMAAVVTATKAGKTVVRLASGDPSIYGALGEQTEWLEREGIDYEIVPGVSSFTAAAAAIRKELTVPDVAQTVILTRSEGRTKLPRRERLSDLAKHRTTIALFLSTQLAGKIQADLLVAYPPDTPFAVVYKATWPDQKVLRGTLDQLARVVRDNKIAMTAMVLVGPALTAKGHRSKLYDASFSHAFRRAAKNPAKVE